MITLSAKYFPPSFVTTRTSFVSLFFFQSMNLTCFSVQISMFGALSKKEKYEENEDGMKNEESK